VHLIIVGGNNSIISATWYIFSFYSKENEGEIIVDKVFIGSKLLSNGEKNQDKKLESMPIFTSNSSPTRNTGAIHLQTNAQDAYHI
jgi:hypothetical protein